MRRCKLTRKTVLAYDEPPEEKLTKTKKKKQPTQHEYTRNKPRKHTTTQGPKIHTKMFNYDKVPSKIRDQLARDRNAFKKEKAQKQSEYLQEESYMTSANESFKKMNKHSRNSSLKKFVIKKQGLNNVVEEDDSEESDNQNANTHNINYNYHQSPNYNGRTKNVCKSGNMRVKDYLQQNRRGPEVIDIANDMLSSPILRRLYGYQEQSRPEKPQQRHFKTGPDFYRQNKKPFKSYGDQNFQSNPGSFNNVILIRDELSQEESYNDEWNRDMNVFYETGSSNKFQPRMDRHSYKSSKISYGFVRHQIK